jgi:hypothetical protein
VRLRANSHCNEICNIREPRTGVELKFSLRGTTALALAGLETSRPDVFSDDNAVAESVVRLRDKVAVDLAPDLALTMCEMEIELDDRRTWTTIHDAGMPTQDCAEQGRRVADKFHALVAPVLGRSRSDLIATEVGRLETLPRVDALMAACL